MTIEDTDFFFLFEASMGLERNLNSQVLKREDSNLNDKIVEILKRELKQESMPIHFTFFKNKKQYCVMIDRIWNDLKEDGLNKVVQEICNHVRFRLGKLYTPIRVALSPKETKSAWQRILRDDNEEQTMKETRLEYKYKGINFNTVNMGSIFIGEINFKYISDAIEEHIAIIMN